MSRIFDRLSAIKNTMGDASAAREYILALLPFEENEQIKRAIASIKSKHPSATVEYHYITFNNAWEGDISSIPQGTKIKLQCRIELTKLVESWTKATILVTLFSWPPDISKISNLKLIHLFSGA